MNSENKYILKVGDKVKIVWAKTDYANPYLGKVGKVRGVLEHTKMLQVDLEGVPSPYNQGYMFYPEELELVEVDSTDNPWEVIRERILEAQDEETEPMELDHLCMPTTQDEIEPIGKSEVLDEISNFINQMKAKGWLVDSLNIDLCHQNNKDFVVVQF